MLKVLGGRGLQTGFDLFQIDCVNATSVQWQMVVVWAGDFGVVGTTRHRQLPSEKGYSSLVARCVPNILASATLSLT